MTVDIAVSTPTDTARITIVVSIAVKVSRPPATSTLPPPPRYDAALKSAYPPRSRASFVTERTIERPAI